MITIFRQFSFDSAHFLPNVPEGHKCKHMHGHTYRMLVYLTGETDAELGWVMDFGDLKTIIGSVVDTIDHKTLNDIEGLENPTCENITIWLWNKLKPMLPLLTKIELHETPNSGAIYTGA